MIDAILERTFRRESGAVLAALIRKCGDFDTAEDAYQDAITRALVAWPKTGIPENPAGWLYSVAHRRLIDFSRSQRPVPLADLPELSANASELPDSEIVPDERLRLLFTCCHPALARQSQVALALRTLGGLTTREVARAFVEPEATTAQRLVRAKQKIREANIPYAVPREADLPERLLSVLEVIYLIFNEGYSATDSPSLIRPDLCREAIRLGRLAVELMPGEPEPRGLLALMMLHDARQSARLTADGDIITLEEQDRSLWNRESIGEANRILDAALPMGRAGPYQIQAAVAALHAKAASPTDTDWPQIAALYGALLKYLPTPVIQLNAATALAMCGHGESALDWMDRLESLLPNYHLLPAARADLLRRAGRNSEAAASYRKAIELVTSEVERRYLERRLKEVLSDP